MNREQTLTRLDQLGDLLGYGRFDERDGSDGYLQARLDLREKDYATTLATAGLARLDSGRVTRFDGNVTDATIEALKGRADEMVDGGAPRNLRDLRDYFSASESAIRASIAARPSTAETRADDARELAEEMAAYDAAMDAAMGDR